MVSTNSSSFWLGRVVRGSSPGARILIKKQLGRGGQGTVYSTNIPRVVAKIYHTPVAGDMQGRLTAMVRNPPINPTKNHPTLAWPVDILFDGSNFIGYLMPEVPKSRSLNEIIQPRDRIKYFPGFNIYYLHQTARNVAWIFRNAHKAGCVIGDISMENLRVTSTALVSLIDTDSFQIQDRQAGKIYHCAVLTPEFAAPELAGMQLDSFVRDVRQDYFGLAIVIYQLLFGEHPCQGLWNGSGTDPTLSELLEQGHFVHDPASPVSATDYTIPKTVFHPRLVGLFEKFFIDGHRNSNCRPTPQDWITTLETAIENLQQCSKANNQHYYSNHNKTCPWCTRAKLLGLDVFPATSIDNNLEVTALSKLKSAISNKNARTAVRIWESNKGLKSANGGKQFAKKMQVLKEKLSKLDSLHDILRYSPRDDDKIIRFWTNNDMADLLEAKSETVNGITAYKAYQRAQNRLQVKKKIDQVIQAADKKPLGLTKEQDVLNTIEKWGAILTDNPDIKNSYEQRVNLAQDRLNAWHSLSISFKDGDELSIAKTWKNSLVLHSLTISKSHQTIISNAIAAANELSLLEDVVTSTQSENYTILKHWEGMKILRRSSLAERPSPRLAGMTPNDLAIIVKQRDVAITDMGLVLKSVRGDAPPTESSELSIWLSWGKYAHLLKDDPTPCALKIKKRSNDAKARLNLLAREEIDQAIQAAEQKPHELAKEQDILTAIGKWQQSLSGNPDFRKIYKQRLTAAKKILNAWNIFSDVLQSKNELNIVKAWKKEPILHSLALTNDYKNTIDAAIQASAELSTFIKTCTSDKSENSTIIKCWDRLRKLSGSSLANRTSSRLAGMTPSAVAALAEQREAAVIDMETVLKIVDSTDISSKSGEQKILQSSEKAYYYLEKDPTPRAVKVKKRLSEARKRLSLLKKLEAAVLQPNDHDICRFANELSLIKFHLSSQLQARVNEAKAWITQFSIMDGHINNDRDGPAIMLWESAGFASYTVARAAYGNRIDFIKHRYNAWQKFQLSLADGNHADLLAAWNSELFKDLPGYSQAYISMLVVKAKIAIENYDDPALLDVWAKISPYPEADSMRKAHAEAIQRHGAFENFLKASKSDDIERMAVLWPILHKLPYTVSLQSKIMDVARKLAQEHRFDKVLVDLWSVLRDDVNSAALASIVAEATERLTQVKLLTKAVEGDDDATIASIPVGIYQHPFAIGSISQATKARERYLAYKAIPSLITTDPSRVLHLWREHSLSLRPYAQHLTEFIHSLKCAEMERRDVEITMANSVPGKSTVTLAWKWPEDVDGAIVCASNSSEFVSIHPDGADKIGETTPVRYRQQNGFTFEAKELPLSVRIFCYRIDENQRIYSSGEASAQSRVFQRRCINFKLNKPFLGFFGKYSLSIWASDDVALPSFVIGARKGQWPLKVEQCEYQKYLAEISQSRCKIPIDFIKTNGIYQVRIFEPKDKSTVSLQINNHNTSDVILKIHK